VSFREGAVPDWYVTSFFPDTLTFTSAHLSKLQSLFAGLPLSPETITSGVLDVGQQLFQFALTVRLAIFTFEQSGRSAGVIRDRTMPFIDVLKETLEGWLSPDIRASLPDFFIGDITTGGIVTEPGIGGQGPQQASFDENNALYSNHHIQYGFWLFAAATVVEWDQMFNTPDPFITKPIRVLNPTRPVIMKDLIDMLWRDARNPDLDDPDLPYNRHGNPWEGHSTQNGILYEPIVEGRNQEFFGQDFSSWVATTLYARAIKAASVLSDEQKRGFDTLETFATTNTQLTATSGELIFQDNRWIYSAPFSTNTTVGNVFDTQVLAETTTDPGTPACPLFPPSLP